MGRAKNIRCTLDEGVLVKLHSRGNGHNPPIGSRVMPGPGLKAEIYRNGKLRKECDEEKKILLTGNLFGLPVNLLGYLTHGEELNDWSIVFGVKSEKSVTLYIEVDYSNRYSGMSRMAYVAVRSDIRFVITDLPAFIEKYSDTIFSKGVFTVEDLRQSLAGTITQIVRSIVSGRVGDMAVNGNIPEFDRFSADIASDVKKQLNSKLQEYGISVCFVSLIKEKEDNSLSDVQGELAIAAMEDDFDNLRKINAAKTEAKAEEIKAEGQAAAMKKLDTNIREVREFIMEIAKIEHKSYEEALEIYRGMVEAQTYPDYVLNNRMFRLNDPTFARYSTVPYPDPMTYGGTMSCTNPGEAKVVVYLVCPNCKTKNLESQNYCGNCGFLLKTDE